MAKANDRIFKALAQLKNSGHDIRARFIRWGVDLEASQSLCRELGLAGNVQWIDPVSKEQLWEEMLLAGAVVDQFLISVISGIGFEALALGRRLITYDDGRTNREFFGEAPPVLSACSSDEIADRMLEVLQDPDDARGIGNRAEEWVKTYHSAARGVELQKAAFER